jgi:hypothetical protein
MSDEKRDVLRELNEREKRKEKKREGVVANTRTAMRGCLLFIAIVGVRFVGTCVAIVREMDTPES